MDTEILDDLFKDEFLELLNPDEKVIWDGHPHLSEADKIILGLKWTIFALIIFYFIKNGWDAWVLFYSIILFFGEMYRMYHREKNRYVITNQRVLFQLYRKRKKTFHTIPFSDIKSISVRKKEEYIAIKVKNRKQYKFKTYSLKNNEERGYPTLEMIENIEEVAGYINKGIQLQLPKG